MYYRDGKREPFVAVTIYLGPVVMSWIAVVGPEKALIKARGV